MRLLGIGDEELGFVRIWSGVRHGHYSTCIELVGKNHVKFAIIYGCGMVIGTFRVDRSSSAKDPPQIL
jgi:hypothetical protein